MEKYAKHIIVGISGSGLAITGAIVLSAVISALEPANIAQHDLMWEIGRLGMWPLFIIGAGLGVAGVFCIFGMIMNLLARDN